MLIMKKQILNDLNSTINRLSKVTNLELYDSLKLSHVISTLTLTREALSENENIQLDRVVDFLDGFEEEINYFLPLVENPFCE